MHWHALIFLCNRNGCAISYRLAKWRLLKMITPTGQVLPAEILRKSFRAVDDSNAPEWPYSRFANLYKVFAYCSCCSHCCKQIKQLHNTYIIDTLEFASKEHWNIHGITCPRVTYCYVILKNAVIREEICCCIVLQYNSYLPLCKL